MVFFCIVLKPTSVAVAFVRGLPTRKEASKQSPIAMAFSTVKRAWGSLNRLSNSRRMHEAGKQENLVVEGTV
jgi:hypothetical protein